MGFCAANDVSATAVRRGAVALVLCAAALTGPAAPVDLYDRPRLQPAHQSFLRQFAGAVARKDAERMEVTCREALKTFPEDEVWAYNLACALNLRKRTDAALDALEQAVAWGFADARHLAEDSDLASLATLPRFRAALKAAERRAKSGGGVLQPAQLVPGGTVELVRGNLAWNYDAGWFVAALKFAEKGGDARSAAERAAAWRGPERELMAAWIADGTAAGNLGDVYVNRDRGHSSVAMADFPGLAAVGYEPAARERNLDMALPNARFPGAAVFGNASLALVVTNGTCSLPRMAYGSQAGMKTLAELYLDNQVWAFPAHKDFAAADGTDRFPCVTPYAMVTEGSSGTDVPYLRAALAASAALPAATKRAVLSRGLLGPTVQWLIRRNLNGVYADDDYLSPKAHPVAFAPGALNERALVKAAHALKPDEVPPVAVLTPLAARQAIGLAARPKFFAATPCAVGVAFHSTDLVRTIPFRASAGGPRVSFGRTTWRVVRGDPARVTFSPGAEPDVTEITLDCRGLTGRVDVACFAKDLGTEWGAPSFVSFCLAEGEWGGKR